MNSLSVILDFFTAAPWWELLLIFVAKIVEVSVSTLRVILINKGYRNQSVLLALVEIFIWVFIASAVITNLTDAPIKGIVYGLGFTVGVYLGSILETKLAFGMILIETIASEQSGITIANHLREIGYGVTVLHGEGRSDKRLVIKVFAKRRNAPSIIKEILAVDETALVIRNDISLMVGGYVARSRSLFK